MKFCQSHWNRLRSAIEQHGMDKLVAKSGQEAIQRTINDLTNDSKNQEPDLKDFDPLMSAHWAIVTEFMEPLGAKGFYIMTGDYCPLCELLKLNPQKPEIDSNWINGVTAHLQKFCLEKGLITAN